MVELYRRPESPRWQARLAVHGRVERWSTGETDKRQARVKAEAEERRRSQLVPEGLCLIDASARFFGERVLKPSTITGYEASLVNLVAVIGDRPMTSIDGDVIAHYVRVRKSGQHGDVSIRRDLAFLSSLFSTASHWEDGPKANPVLAYPKKGLRDARARNRWLRISEYEALLKEAKEPYLSAYITISCLTGLRPSELLQLRYDQVDLRNDEIVIGNLNDGETKTSEGRIVPILPHAKNTLLNTHRSVFVIHNPRSGKPFKRLIIGVRKAAERAGLRGVSPYVFRHTFCTWALNAGVPDTIVQDIMGHKTASMTRRYTHASREQLNVAREKLSLYTKAHDFRLPEGASTD